MITRHGDRITEWVLPVPPGDQPVVWTCSANSLHLPSDDLDSFMINPKRLYRKLYITNREEVPGNCSLGQLTEKGSVNCK